MKPTRVHVAIPAMNEADYLPGTIECLQEQEAPGVEAHLWICVNQPDRWWRDATREAACLNNRRTLESLANQHLPNLHLIDRSSPGRGWTGKDHGVGMARRTLMDAIDLWCFQRGAGAAPGGKASAGGASAKTRDHKSAQPQDIILSLDADTRFGPGYLASVVRQLQAHPTAMGLSNPYYHRLTGDEDLDRALLRYEIYMRHYALNLWRIESPYSFTALGSAIALPLRAYRKIGGMTAKKSGEDFYLLQKLRKAGPLLHHNTERVYPATRYSDRVFFGTGPALIRGKRGDWDSYPVYDHRLFDRVGETCRAFPALYDRDADTPMTPFLQKQLGTRDVFGPLRRNAATRDQFVRACHHRVDGLRVLQFLKASQAAQGHADEKYLLAFLREHHPGIHQACFSSEGLDFGRSPIALMDKIRNLLMETEDKYREADARALSGC